MKNEKLDESDVTDNEIENFIKMMKKRLKMGRKLYPDMLFKQDIVKEWEEEIVDLANYAILLWCKLKRLERVMKLK